jgi:hypothetical protein
VARYRSSGDGFLLFRSLRWEHFGSIGRSPWGDNFRSPIVLLPGERFLVALGDGRADILALEERCPGHEPSVAIPAISAAHPRLRRHDAQSTRTTAFPLDRGGPGR